MGSTTDAIDQIAFLARSGTRVRMLELLLERNAVTRHECREALDASRSTVARTLDALEERGWVRCSGRSYELTAAGAVVAKSFLELAEAVDATDELSAFLRHFPHEQFDVELAALHDAEITVSTAAAPFAPATRQTDLVREASQLCSMLPSVEIEGCRSIHERTLADEFEAESIVSPSVADRIIEGEFATLHREMLETGRHAIFEADAELPFYLGLTGEGEVHVGVEDDEGFPQALLVSDAARVRSWAESVYEDQRARATPMSVADFETDD